MYMYNVQLFVVKSIFISKFLYAPSLKIWMIHFRPSVSCINIYFFLSTSVHSIEELPSLNAGPACFVNIVGCRLTSGLILATRNSILACLRRSILPWLAAHFLSPMVLL